MQKRRRRREKREYFYDYTLLFVVMFLVFFGLIMLYSTSSYEATLDFGNGAYYLKKQAMATVLGLVMMLFISVVDYHVWRRFALPAYLISLVLVVLVKTPLGYEANGARRWIKIAGVSLQPAEVVKITLILLLASVICIMGKQVRTWRGIIIVMGAALIPAVMILFITKNMSSAIIIAGIAAVMLFVADPHYTRYIVIAVSAVCLAALVVVVIYNAAKGGASPTGGFRGTRILAWLIRRPIQIIPDSRHCRHYMRSVPADCGAKGSDRVCRSLAFCLRRRMIWYFPLSVKSLDCLAHFA